MSYSDSFDLLPGQEDVYSVTFSQDYSEITVGTRTGFTLVRWTSDHMLVLEHFKTKPLRIVELLPESCVVATVNLSSPRDVLIMNIKRKHKIINVNHPNNIHSVKQNRLHIVVCLEDYLYIYNRQTMKELHMIKFPFHNRDGLLTVSIKDNSFIAYPGSNHVGLVHIFDAHYLKSKVTISAHVSRVTALQFNETGTMIATASKTGTLIRIFNVNDGTKLHEFRIGTLRSANICSLSFSADDQFLLCSSTLETVHIFKLGKTINEQYEDSPGLLGSITNILFYVSSYLHSSVAGILRQERAFATVTLPFAGIKNSGAIVMIEGQPRILVATADGLLYIYNFNMDDGGECPLLTEHRLFVDPKTGKSNSVPVPSRSPPVAEFPDPDSE